MRGLQDTDWISQEGNVDEEKTAAQPESLGQPEDPQAWRQALIQQMLRVVVVVAVIAVAAGVSALQTLWMLPFYIGAVILLAVLAFWKRVTYTVRVVGLLTLAYVMGVLGLWEDGLSGDGRVFLLALPILATLFFGRREGLLTLALSALTLAAFGGAFSTGRLTIPQEARISAEPLNWLSGTLVYLLLGTVLVISMGYLVSRLIGALARSAALVALLRAQRARQEEQTEVLQQREAELTHRSTQLQALLDVGRAANSTLDPDEMLRQVVNLIRERFGYYYVAGFLLDETRRYAVLQTATGEAGRVLMEHGQRLEVDGSTLIGSAIASARPRIALRDEIEAMRRANPLLPDTRSEIALPLRVGERAIGALDVHSAQPNAFDEAMADVLQSMADQIAVVLGNVRLYAEIHQRAGQQEGLARIAALVGSALPLDELLERLMVEAREMLDAEIALVLLKDQTRQALVGRHVVKGAPQSPEEWHVPLTAPGFENSLFVRGGSYYSNQATQDPNIIRAYLPYLQGLNVQNFGGVALRVRDQSLGELYVANRPGGFGREDLALLKTIAGYAANAIQNARLFEEAQRLATREQVIGTLTTRIRESLDMEMVLKTAAQQVRQALGVPEVLIRLVAPPTPEPGDGRGKEALP